MAFLTEPSPPRGERLDVLPGVTRLVAANGGIMTYHGTNTYLVECPDGLVVLDPGPEDDAHIEHVLAATEGAITAIFLTHGHSDHSGAAARLRKRTAAPIVGFHAGWKGARPDVALFDGDTFSGLTAVHTPGHAPDHLCYAVDDILFSGDHVMSWSSSIVAPPSGDMAAYCAGLRMLMGRDEGVYLPGHGPPLRNPRPYVADLLRRRVAREEEILAEVAARAMIPVEISEKLYSKSDPYLKKAAELNVEAHLIKLSAEGRVRVDRAGRWSAIPPGRAPAPTRHDQPEGKKR